ncbi:MAG: PfkB family carbohydrate kinase [Romboutsia timonensis]
MKISDEELEFITEMNNVEEAIKSLFVGDVEIILYTKGKDGVDIYTKEKYISVDGFKVECIDTTGAGDSFIGAFLYKLSREEVNLKNDNQLKDIGIFFK